jgi:hypothetical protein
MTSPTLIQQTSSSSRPPALRGLLTAVSAGAVAELAPVWQLPTPELPQALFDVLPPLVERWALASASTAAEWYDQLRESATVPGRFTAVVPPMDNLGAEPLAAWGNQALATPIEEISPDALPPLESARSRVEGGLQKRVVNAANLVVTESAAQDPKARGWMRVTRPGACKFCVMVASRGGVYTRATSTFACHEHCHCTAVPAWGGQELPVGPYKPSQRPQTAADRARVRKWIKDNL